MPKFTAIPSIDPRNAKDAYEFGLRAREIHSEREAIPVLQEATKANPSHASLWQILGLLHRALDQLELAVGAFRQAAQLAPEDPLIAHGYARVVLEAGLPATHLFNLAHNLAPADGAVLIGRSAAQLAEGDIANAISDLDVMLSRNPAWQEGHSALSRLRWMSGDHQQFTLSIDRALRQTSNSPLLWSQLVLTRLQAKQYRHVLEAIARARLALGQPDAFLYIEACSVAELDLTAQADELFAKVGDDENAMLVEHRVRHLLRAGRADEASKFAETRLGGQLHDLIFPYATIAWRLLDDERWDAIAEHPNLLGVYDILDALPPLDQLTDVLKKLHLTQHEPLEQSLRGGTQTDGPLLSNINPLVQDLRRALLATGREHVSKIYLANRRTDAALTDLKFAGSWSVLLRGAGLHANHVHQAGWISSALYISVPQQQEMGKSPAGWFTLGQPPAELKTGLAPIKTVEPKPGRLVLFPSTMWHGTNPIESGERLTVAFDIAPIKTD